MGQYWGTGSRVVAGLSLLGCSALAVCLITISPPAPAAQLVGTITVQVEGQGRTEPPRKPPPDETQLADDNSRRVKDVLHIEACITDGVTAVGRVRRSISDVTDKKLDRESKYTWCTVGKHSVKRTPGPRFTQSESTRIKTYTGPGASDPRSATQVSLGPLVGESTAAQLERLQDNPQSLMEQLQQLSEGLAAGPYQMTVDNWVMLDMQIDQSNIDTDVCSGKATRATTRWRTSAPDTAETMALNTATDGSTSTITTPPTQRGLAAMWELRVDPKGFAGSTLVDESEPVFSGGYREKTSAEWSFRPAAPCDRIKDAIRHDLAYAEAYAAAGPRRQCVGRYLCYVDQLTYSILHNGRPAPFPCDDKPCDVGNNEDAEGEDSSEGAEVEIGVDGNCVLQNEQEFLDKMAGQCAPEGEVDGILAHEAVHVKQCKHDRQLYNSPDNDYWGDTEVRAHLAGVRVMLDWMKDNCPDDTRALEQRMKNIESSWRAEH